MQSVSAIDYKQAKVWFALTLISALFAFIYELCSFGVYSIFMLGLPAIPALLGVIPSIWFPEGMGRSYNDGVLTLMAGFTLLGILEIYGTSSVWPLWMVAAGGILLMAGIAKKCALIQKTEAQN